MSTGSWKGLFALTFALNCAFSSVQVAHSQENRLDDLSGELPDKEIINLLESFENQDPDRQSFSFATQDEESFFISDDDSETCVRKAAWKYWGCLQIVELDIFASRQSTETARQSCKIMLKKLSDLCFANAT